MFVEFKGAVGFKRGGRRKKEEEEKKCVDY
jgi:hypothetical protein